MKQPKAGQNHGRAGEWIGTDNKVNSFIPLQE